MSDENFSPGANDVDESNGPGEVLDAPVTSFPLRVTSAMATLGFGLFVYIPIVSGLIVVASIFALFTLVLPPYFLDAGAIQPYSFDTKWLNGLYLCAVAWRTTARVRATRRADEPTRIVRALSRSAIEVLGLLVLVNLVLGLGGEVNAVLSQWLPKAGGLLTFALCSVLAARVAVGGGRRLSAITRRSPVSAKIWSVFGLTISAIPFTLFAAALSSSEAESADPGGLSSHADVSAFSISGDYEPFGELSEDFDDELEGFGLERPSLRERCLRKVLGDHEQDGYSGEAALVLQRTFRVESSEATDIAHDVAIKICEKNQHIRVTKLRDYYFKSIHYAGIDFSKRRRAHKRYCNTVWDSSRDRATSPDYVLRLTLDRVYSNLDEDDREMFDLKFMQELSPCELGQTLGITEVAARKRVSRLREKLRANIQR